MKVDVLTASAAATLLAGIIASYVAFRKLKPESDQIVVSAAKDVVLIQAGAMARQNAQMARQDVEMAELREEMATMREQFRTQERAAAVALAECNAERRELRRERDAERANNWELRSRIEVLEAEVARLRAANGDADPLPRPTD